MSLQAFRDGPSAGRARAAWAAFWRRAWRVACIATGCILIITGLTNYLQGHYAQAACQYVLAVLMILVLRENP